MAPNQQINKKGLRELKRKRRREGLHMEQEQRTRFLKKQLLEIISSSEKPKPEPETKVQDAAVSSIGLEVVKAQKKASQ